MSRKLTTILAADVAGFSRLIGTDETGTMIAFREAREIVDRLISEWHGRIFSTAGDSVFAEFNSAVEATEAAIAIQRALASAQQSSNRPRIRFRIGLNVGDIVVDGDGLMGDGVNVAARIEAKAEAGGICLSRSVYEQVRGKIDAVFETLGRHRLKNIAQPVTLYRLALDGDVRSSSKTAPTAPPRPAGPRRARRTRGTRSSIAVLPLEVLDGDAATKRLAVGVAEDIITDLSRLGDLDIVASDSARALAEKLQDVRSIGRKLNAAYLLQGAIQHMSGTYRVTAKLVDALSGTYVWTDRWEYSGDPTFDLQGQIAERIASTIGSSESSAALTGSEIRKAKSRPPASLAAYDYYLLAVEARGRSGKEEIIRGIEFATKAIALDAGFARAYATRARLHYNTIHYGTDFETAMRAMEADVRKAVDLAPGDPECRITLAWYYSTRGRNKDAEAELRTSLAANPANITVMKLAATIYACCGHPEAGAALADKVLRLDPFASSGTLNTIKDAYFFARRFEDAVAVITRVPPNARTRGSRLLLVLSLALLGREDELAEARDELARAHPDLSAELLFNEGWKLDRPEDERLLRDGFAMAGLPISGG